MIRSARKSITQILLGGAGNDDTDETGASHHFHQTQTRNNAYTENKSDDLHRDSFELKESMNMRNRPATGASSAMHSFVIPSQFANISEEQIIAVTIELEHAKMQVLAENERLRELEHELNSVVEEKFQSESTLIMRLRGALDTLREQLKLSIEGKQELVSQTALQIDRLRNIVRLLKDQIKYLTNGKDPVIRTYGDMQALKEAFESIDMRDGPPARQLDGDTRGTVRRGANANANGDGTGTGNVYQGINSLSIHNEEQQNGQMQKPRRGGSCHDHVHCVCVSSVQYTFYSCAV